MSSFDVFYFRYFLQALTATIKHRLDPFSKTLGRHFSTVLCLLVSAILIHGVQVRWKSICLVCSFGEETKIGFIVTFKPLLCLVLPSAFLLALSPARPFICATGNLSFASSSYSRGTPQQTPPSTRAPSVPRLPHPPLHPPALEQDLGPTIVPSTLPAQAAPPSFSPHKHPLAKTTKKFGCLGFSASPLQIN